ncbi:hypothetical protein PFAG_06023 [Plasmodium falciparum Santa Lucia]|uniref:Uncharacterized protein n=2 Tax=Plasmodium falciparum TaxID=5833 RepID=A0A024WGH8_PLAFA|nr:hypothetical protein PFMALIP_05856 [Plasmodium falciparum MaliPS096_E11]EUT73813.1 hypothetical protein PFAG_06023 [Plasmodium falciparum Santa Lucia]
MENNQSIYSAMCIYDHLTVVMKRYNFHLNNMNYGKEHITQLLQNKNQSTSTFNLNNQNILNSLIIRNEMILNNLYNNLLKDIEKKKKIHKLMKLKLTNITSESINNSSNTRDIKEEENYREIKTEEKDNQ